MALLLLIIVKKAIEKAGVRARTLRRDKPGAFAQTRTMHAAMLYGVGTAASTPLVSFEPFAWGDLKFFSRLFQQGTHDFKGRNHGRPGALRKYVQAHLLQLARLPAAPIHAHTDRGEGWRGPILQCK